MRTAKQLCKTAPTPSEVGGVPVGSGDGLAVAFKPQDFLSQGCLPGSLYSSDSFEVPNGLSLPYYASLASLSIPLQPNNFDPYASTTQSRNLRVIETTLNPQYKAKNDTLELNADYRLTPALTFSSQTGFNNDFLWSTEDYNRFNTAPGAFIDGGNNTLGELSPDPNGLHVCTGSGSSPCLGLPVGTPCTVTTSSDCAVAGLFCDPQLGCSDRLVAQDLSDEHAWQLSQEFRLSSNFSGPFNFSVGGNYLHYETEENYYVFINTLSLASYAWPHDDGPSELQQTLPWVPGVSDNSNCLDGGFVNSNPYSPNKLGTEGGQACIYIDPNPLGSLNNKGHNYFLSQNPYTLNSYAGFGEVYYNVFRDLKLTTGLRWTEDQKHFTDIPSELLVAGYGYPSTGIVNQQWDQFTGRAAVNWTPKLDFTDQTLVYGSYAHGYKAGGANPPGAELLTLTSGDISNPIHPLTFKPEFIDAFELGSKNTLLDGALTLNGDVFYYNYENYQISEIVDRTSINLNFDAHVHGAEIEATYEPLPGLRFNFSGGYEGTSLAKGSQAIDLIDRTAGNPDWMVVKPYVTQSSNCILPTYVVKALLQEQNGSNWLDLPGACQDAYIRHRDPVSTPPVDYPGFDYTTAPNGGEGFYKSLGGNELPNAPPFTVSFGSQYSMPLTSDWVGTLRGDFYWQDNSWARVFDDNPYDRLHGYTNLNLTLIFTNQDGWQAMFYDKNVFNTTAITGTFLNSDDAGLTTNLFLTDPKLIGIRVTKNW
jgi:iron complex outermembrane recepter protein